MKSIYEDALLDNSTTSEPAQNIMVITYMYSVKFYEYANCIPMTKVLHEWPQTNEAVWQRLKPYDPQLAYLFLVSPAFITDKIADWCQTFNCRIVPNNSADQTNCKQTVYAKINRRMYNCNIHIYLKRSYHSPSSLYTACTLVPTANFSWDCERSSSA